MDTFGDRLKSERDNRGLGIPALAETLRVDPSVLTALEDNAYDALPDEAVLMDCLRAYAECLDVDADLMLADFLEEREKARRELETEVPEPGADAAAAADATAPRSEPPFQPWTAALVTLAVTALVTWWLLSRDATPRRSERPAEPATTESSRPAPAPPRSPASPIPPDPPIETAGPPREPPAEADPIPEPPVAQPRTEPPPRRSTTANPALPALDITDYGVGTGVEDRLLVGQSDRFPAGTRVCFWTRVRGGAEGRSIDHVWLFEGVETSRISLRIGGPTWRTYSARTIPENRIGNWAVEARDEAGRVLARSEFISR